MTTHAPLKNSGAFAQCAPNVKADLKAEACAFGQPGQPQLPSRSDLDSAPAPNREQVRKLVHGLASAALLACTVCAASAAAAVDVAPLSEEVFTSPINNVTLPADKRPDGWQTGPLIPTEEWKRYSNRPNALASHPQDRVAVAEAYPGGATGYVRDPAYLPVLPLEQPKATTTRKSQKKQTTATPYGPTVARPTVQRPTTPAVASPKVPTVAAPKVVAPVASTAAAPAAPAPAVTAPAVTAPAGTPATPPTGPVAAPYSEEAPATGPVVASPTPPSNPSSPSSPSLAAQSPAQDGVMATGRGTASDVAPKPAVAANGAVTANSGQQLNMGERRAFLGGQADTLVVPPTGISLQPNNGSAALTAPANPQ